ncbi:MAG: FAD-binding oxidoreductase, partial [Actinomycetota bacterium]|nr:FAD-binding oxidoreductase [Actinomycetota bacterium]
ARAVERRGAAVYEGTGVTAVRPRGRGGPRLRTAYGDVRADVVVLAGEAWLAQLPGWRRSVLPLYSLVVLTEPLSPARWSQIGWDGGECLSSHRLTVDYLSRTEDGRILFGGRGVPYRFGSAMSEAQAHHGPTHAMLRRHLVEWFPPLRRVGFADAWGGAVGMPRDWLPTFFFNPRTGLAGAYGYTGQGVAAANLAGRVLADLITTGSCELGDLPMVNHPPRRWEPEPLRWLAVRYLQGALARVDARARRSGRPPGGRALAERLTRH